MAKIGYNKFKLDETLTMKILEPDDILPFGGVLFEDGRDGLSITPLSHEELVSLSIAFRIASRVFDAQARSFHTPPENDPRRPLYDRQAWRDAKRKGA